MVLGLNTPQKLQSGHANKHKFMASSSDIWLLGVEKTYLTGSSSVLITQDHDDI